MVGALQAQALPAADRTPFCYLDFASQTAEGIELHFERGSAVAVAITKAGQVASPSDQVFLEKEGHMHKTQPGSGKAESATSEVVLSSSDKAYVGTDPHGSFTIQSARQGASLGVVMKVGVSLPGLAPQTESRFLPIGTHGPR